MLLITDEDGTIKQRSGNNKSAHHHVDTTDEQTDRRVGAAWESYAEAMGWTYELCTTRRADSNSML